jgi:hypothetical protein
MVNLALEFFLVFIQDFQICLIILCIEKDILTVVSPGQHMKNMTPWRYPRHSRHVAILAKSSPRVKKREPSPFLLDILAINGINIVNAINAPLNHFTVAYFVYDLASDHVTNLARPITDFPPLLFATMFLSAVDVYLAGTTPPSATIAIAEIPRGDCGAMHGINVPNWAIINEAGTFTESISVLLDDYIEGRCDETWDSHGGHGHD